MRAIANPKSELGQEILYRIKQNQILEPLWELVDKADDWKAYVSKLPFEDLIVLQERLAKFHDGKLIVIENFSDHSDQIDYEYKVQVLREMYPYVNSLVAERANSSLNSQLAKKGSSYSLDSRESQKNKTYTSHHIKWLNSLIDNEKLSEHSLCDFSGDELIRLRDIMKNSQNKSEKYLKLVESINVYLNKMIHEKN